MQPKSKSIDYNFNKELSEDLHDMSLDKIRNCL